MMLMGLGGFAGLGAGLGDYTSDSLCSEIPAGDPYRTPGNYCTQPSGNVIEFNADGSVDPDPYAADSSSSSDGGGSSWWDSAVNTATALVTGAAKGYAAGSVKPPKVLPVTPWYMTPIGIVGILGALGIAGWAILKK